VIMNLRNASSEHVVSILGNVSPHPDPVGLHIVETQ